MNGKDSEYCPDTEQTFDDLKPFQINRKNGTSSTIFNTNSKKRSKKNLQGCVFCKNNGEEESVYKQHVLKDADGKVKCPILKAYTCPICGAKGEGAHTIKYCPQNPHPEEIASVVLLKNHRSATGQQRRNRCLGLVQ